MKITALSCILLLSFAACKNKPTPPPPPNTPEQVVRVWQAGIDRNQFEIAKNLSTGEALNYIAELESLTEGDSLEWENNELLNLRCQIIGDSAHCTYHFEDELGEPDPGELALKRVKGQWLVCRTDFENEPHYDSLHHHDDMIFPGDTLDEEIE